MTRWARDLPDRDWMAGWEANRQAGLDAVVSATPTQRLGWLEEALRLAHRVGALPKREEPPASWTREDEPPHS